MNAFHVAGALLTLWAVVLAFLGIRRPDFPGRGAERLVMAVSSVLTVVAIGAAVVSGRHEHEEKEKHEHELEAHEEARRIHEVKATMPGAGEVIELTAAPSGRLRFVEEELHARPGRATLVMHNPSPLPHNIVIDTGDVEVEGPTAGPGGTSTVSADLPPGRYSYFCSILGHHEGGMDGELTVR